MPRPQRYLHWAAMSHVLGVCDKERTKKTPNQGEQDLAKCFSVAATAAALRCAIGAASAQSAFPTNPADL
jgi:hypothetical protein